MSKSNDRNIGRTIIKAIFDIELSKREALISKRFSKTIIYFKDNPSKRVGLLKLLKKIGIDIDEYTQKRF